MSVRFVPGVQLRIVKYFCSTMGVHLGINHRRNTGSNPARSKVTYLQGSQLKLYLHIVVYNAIVDAKG